MEATNQTKAMILIWRGWGILAALYALAALFVGTIVQNAVGGGLRAPVAIGICEIVAALAVWLTGVRLNSQPDRQLVDVKTGQQVRLQRRHTLFWVPMQYWAPILGVVGVILVVVGIVR